jgi:hypothetical protein
VKIDGLPAIEKSVLRLPPRHVVQRFLHHRIAQAEPLL